MSLAIENADQAVELERGHQKARKEFLEGVGPNDEASPKVCTIPRILFQRAIAFGVDYSVAVVADRNVVEKREKMEYVLERVGG